MPKVQKAESSWKNRIIGSGEESPTALLANPKNWRIHPKHQQDALRGVLTEVGWVQNVIVNKRTGHVIDGHLRVSLAIERKEETVPVVYVDLSEAEESLILATIDPLASLAETSKEKLEELLQEVSTGSEALQLMLTQIGASIGIGDFTDANKEWNGMPEFQQEDLTAWKRLIVNFASKSDYEDFSKLVGQTLTEKTRSIWFPLAEIGRCADKQYQDES